MEKALQNAREPEGVWEELKYGGRTLQTCTRFAGRLIDAMAILGKALCDLLLRFSLSFYY